MTRQDSLPVGTCPLRGGGSSARAEENKNVRTMSAFKNFCIRCTSLYSAHAGETPMLNAFKEEWNLVKGNIASNMIARTRRHFHPIEAKFLRAGCFPVKKDQDQSFSLLFP